MLLMAVLTALLALPGCGGDDNGGEGKPAKGEDQAKLLVSQANADLQLFCIRARLSSTGRDLQNTGFIDAARSVNVLADQQRQYPDMKVPVSQQNPAVPIKKVVSDNLATLQRKCGTDGKLLAVRLQRGTSSG
jgi:hypothetical protein